MTGGNARRGPQAHSKGLAVERKGMRRRVSGTEPSTARRQGPYNDTELPLCARVLLKSRMSEIDKSGSVRGIEVFSHG